MKLSYHDIEVGLDFEPEPGLADNGDLETDLTMPLEQVKFLHFHFRRFDAVGPRGSISTAPATSSSTSSRHLNQKGDVHFILLMLCF